MRPTWPNFLIAVVAGAIAVALLHAPVETIGTRFGGIPASLPSFAFPHIPIERTLELFPSSFTIAFLAGVESLLSAVVADGMIGGRHRSNCELVAQGVANVGSALFGGLPATGALARTATTCAPARARRSPASCTRCSCCSSCSCWRRSMSYVPLAALAAMLVVVAWNMAEIESFRHLMTGRSAIASCCC